MFLTLRNGVGRFHYGFQWITSRTHLASSAVDATPLTFWIIKIVGWFDCHILLLSASGHFIIQIRPFATLGQEADEWRGLQGKIAPSPSSGFITTLLLRPDGYGQRRIIFMRGTL